MNTEIYCTSTEKLVTFSGWNKYIFCCILFLIYLLYHRMTYLS